MKEKNVAKLTANYLLETQAITLRPEDPFTWASGRRSPIYCDNRVTLSYPKVRLFIKQALAEAIKTNFRAVEAIAGVATAGIPQGALTADTLNLPFCYIRSTPKSHGAENLIEGKIIPGQKTVVIEDLISTGGSSIKAVNALREAGVEVIGLGAVFSYGFKEAENNLQKNNIEYFCLSDYDELVNAAAEKKLFSEGEINLLKAWRDDPENWENR